MCPKEYFVLNFEQLRFLCVRKELRFALFSKLNFKVSTKASNTIQHGHGTDSYEKSLTKIKVQQRFVEISDHGNSSHLRQGEPNYST